MSDEAFDEQRLTERLSKLNSSQQSIESLSQWCISHRKKAKQIVEAWDKTFNAAQREQRVSLLYLSNDILQNSRRKGSEFVSEFWKVLPAAIKYVYGHGDAHGKKAASRLVDIWEDRKVFGSRGQNLKDQMLGKAPPPVVSNGRSSNAVKIMKRDAHSLRVKMAVGGTPEKIMTAFLSVHDENINEEESIDKCRSVGGIVGEMMKDVEKKSAQGSQHQSSLAHEIQEQESVLEQCVQQLENAEAARSSLVSQLNDALQEQEMKLADIRTHLQVARGQIEEMSHVRKKLSTLPVPTSMAAAPPSNQLMTESMMVDPRLSSSKPPATSTPPPLQPAVSFATLKTSEEDNKKATAAAVAAKLAASTSSAQMLTSVLSSLVAEEAASRNGVGQKSAGFSSSLPMFSPEKRPKLEKPMAPSDQNNPDMLNGGYFTSMPPPVPPTSMQSNQLQAPYPSLPPITPVSSSANQFVQSAGMMMGVMPYGYGANGLPPPPPPLPSHIAMGLARPGPLPLQQPQQPQQSPQHQHQQLPTTGGYYRPPGGGFYGQTTPPPVPR